MLRILFNIFFLLAVFLASAKAHAQQSVDFDGIDDNSFLMDEGYTQDPGTVQNILYGIAYPTNPKDIYLNLSQEWGISERHQAGFTLPITIYQNTGDGVGDLFLDYRFQLLKRSAWVAIAPRFSLILPTGSPSKNLGYGTVGLQMNWAFSRLWNKHIVTHLNIGGTLLPYAKQYLSSGDSERNFLGGFNAGASAAWMLNKHFNMVLEFVGNMGSEIANSRNTNVYGQYILNPGMSTSIDIGSVEIVPGLSAPLSWNRGDFQPGIFFYLSVQNPFRKQTNGSQEFPPPNR